MRAALELINACLKSDYEKARTVEPEIVELYMHFLNRCLVKTSGPSLTSAALSSLIDLLDRDPKLLSNKPVADAIMIRLRHFVAHTDVDTRRRADGPPARKTGPGLGKWPRSPCLDCR